MVVSGAFRKREINTYEVKCPRCGDTFENHFIATPGRLLYCTPCIKLMKTVSMLQSKLLKEELLLEQNDTQIAEQISSLLAKESVDVSKENEDLLKALVEKLFDDNKRQKGLLKAIRKLQNKKR